uniref:Uncharacterized protein n=1 Tax=Anguilla anguilla TaxID=7936 RepID=A0A0E9UVK3_ANGAN
MYNIVVISMIVCYTIKGQMREENQPKIYLQSK